MNVNRWPKGWNERRVRRVLLHYESQNDEEAVMEDESAFEDSDKTIVEVPSVLMPIIRELIGQYEQAKPKAKAKQSARKRH